MAPVSKVHIDPAKFTIYDSDLSDECDSDFDSEEWVSITSASATTTVSSLPQHLVLKPKITRTTKASTASSSLPQLMSTPQPACCATHSLTKVNCERDQSEAPRARNHATLALKAKLPTLNAIYLVSRDSLDRYLSPSWCPSHIALPRASPVQINTPSGKEQYIRICADCASPHRTFFCDGTWTMRSAEFCSVHSEAMQNMTAVKCDMFGRCRHPPGMGSCPNCDKEKHREFAAMVLEVVQPFNRSMAESQGIRIFDTQDQNAKKLYVHKDGCDCSSKATLENTAC